MQSENHFSDRTSVFDGACGRPFRQQSLSCLIVHRVCLITEQDDQLIQADAIRDLPSDGFRSTAIVGVVQNALQDDKPICLAGVYSDGSSAAWMFFGWSVNRGIAARLKYMAKGELHSDAVPAKTVANVIYDVYRKHGRVDIDPRKLNRGFDDPARRLRGAGHRPGMSIGPGALQRMSDNVQQKIVNRRSQGRGTHLKPAITLMNPFSYLCSVAALNLET